MLIFASGNIIHNLRLVDWNNPTSGHPWAVQMNKKVHEFIKMHQYENLVKYKEQGEEFIKAINSA